MNKSPETRRQDVSREFWEAILSVMEDLFPKNEEIFFAKTCYQEHGAFGHIISCLRRYIHQESNSRLKEECDRILKGYQQQLLETRNHTDICDIGKMLDLDVATIFLEHARSLPALPTDPFSDYHLVDGIINKGTREEIDTVIHACTQNPNYNSVQSYGTRYPVEPNERFKIVKRYAKMCETTQRDEGSDSVDSWLSIANAAHCIATMQVYAYDAVIGILGSGAHIPNMIHAYGTRKTGLIEFHRSQPEWYQPEWVVRPDIPRNGKILLCENDADTGTTLRDVFLQVNSELDPQSVDVCFTGFSFPHSRATARSMHMFKRIFHARELPQDHVYSNFLEVRRKMRKCCRGK